MSPELGFVLFIACLWGPTALWLIARQIRGHLGRLPPPFDADSRPMYSSHFAPAEPRVAVAPDAFWVCEPCRSLNRREADRCYSCKTPKELAGPEEPDEPTVTTWVPVMDEGIARSPGGGAGVGVVRTASANTARGAEILALVPEQDMSAPPPEPLADMFVCPFLGFKDDPLTRFDFPDPANLCHATDARRPLPIDLEHQESLCLAAIHEECSLYPEIDVVAANR